MRACRLLFLVYRPLCNIFILYCHNTFTVDWVSCSSPNREVVVEMEPIISTNDFICTERFRGKISSAPLWTFDSKSSKTILAKSCAINTSDTVWQNWNVYFVLHYMSGVVSRYQASVWSVWKDDTNRRIYIWKSCISVIHSSYSQYFMWLIAPTDVLCGKIWFWHSFSH